MASVLLRRADQIQPGEILLLAGGSAVLPTRIVRVQPSANLIELWFDEGGDRILGYAHEHVLCILEPDTPWPSA